MAKGKARRAVRRANTGQKSKAARRPAHRQRARPARRPKAVARKRAASAPRAPKKAAAQQKVPRLDRERRLFVDDVVPTPPSSLNMERRGSAARTGRAELAESRQDHATMSPAITGGDVDANLEQAYFSGDEAPGGDNPTPDQDVVDDIGKALGLQYQDAEELGGEKVAARDKHRWELDPASADDYKDRG